jgi:hypothetical protein
MQQHLATIRFLRDDRANVHLIDQTKRLQKDIDVQQSKVGPWVIKT